VQVSGQGVPELNCLSLPFSNDLGNPRATDCVPAPNATADAADAAEPHFTGKERDTETGLDYFGARYYASNMGGGCRRTGVRRKTRYRTRSWMIPRR
jgi:hypothetical protein